MNDYVADMRQRLVQLNRLEDQTGESQRRRDQSLDDEVLIESLRANISASVLLHHYRLRARGRRSVAEIRHGVCSGCHMALPIGTQAEVKRQTALLKCENCGRFIFLAQEEMDVSEVPAAPKERQPSRRSTNH
jgi:predicted  nucleic acid-binding Zn-ribbon protein